MKHTLCVLILFACCVQGASNLGTVSGSVLDSLGKPIPGQVRVFISMALDTAAIKTPSPPVQTGPQVTSRFADEAGQFTVGNLAPGNYVACASTSTPGYLDPCQWSTAGFAFIVTAGQITSGVKLILQRGAIIPVRINDLAQTKMLVDQNGPHDPDLQIHAVTASGRHILAAITGQDRSGRDNVITVPFSTAVRLQVFSKTSMISESTNKLFAPGGLTVTVPPGGSATPVILNIVGAKGK